MNQTNEKKFSFRGLVSVITAFCFIVLAFTGAILFIVPPGRFVNSVGWALMGLEKEQWQTMHACFALLFVVAGILHVYLNWRPLINYFKSRLSKRFALRWDWALALVLCVVLGIGVVTNLKPFTSLAQWKENLKQSWERNYYAQLFPMPPADQLADMTLGQLAQETGVNLNNILYNLEIQGAKIDSTDALIGDLAAANNTTARHLSNIALGQTALGAGRPRNVGHQANPSQAESEEHVGGAGGGLGGGMGGGGMGGGRMGGGGMGGGGVGLMTLEKFCSTEQLELAEALKKLQNQGIQADASMTMRAIADRAGVHPRELRNLLFRHR